MIELNLPKYDFKLKRTDNKIEVFDAVRKKYLKLTPEEWVRQHFVMFLLNEKQIPLSHISIEHNLKLNNLDKRCDILVYNKDYKEVMIVECKAPNVSLNQKTFDQIARYNYVLNVKYLVVTNGIIHYYAKIDFYNNNYKFLTEIPDYKELNSK